MDYTTQGLAFKIRKVLRYVRIYGPRRTWAKIRGQYHMKKRYDPLPAERDLTGSKAHVGLIGCGNFAFSNIAYYLKKNYGAVMRGAMDTDIHKAASLFDAWGLGYYTDDAERILSDPAIDLVFVASNHASHAEYAIRALENGKCVHIEKPHVVSEDQLIRLCETITRRDGRVSLGFNRPISRIGLAIKDHLDSQSGAAMYNWFLAGHELPPDHWYFSAAEGGRVLGNLCHWTDFVYQLVPAANRHPITVTPTRAEKSDCDIAVTYVFGDGTVAAITFSAKGHTFEGVRESFAAHRGNVLISMLDFKKLIVENVAQKHRVTSLFRDHGHEARICGSYAMTRPDWKPGDQNSVAYIWETGELFLKTREALDANERLEIRPYDRSRVRTATGNTSEP